MMRHSLEREDDARVDAVLIPKAYVREGVAYLARVVTVRNPTSNAIVTAVEGVPRHIARTVSHIEVMPEEVTQRHLDVTVNNPINPNAVPINLTTIRGRHFSAPVPYKGRGIAPRPAYMPTKRDDA